MDKPIDIQKATIQYFRETFSEPHKSRPTFSNLSFNRLSQDQDFTLTAPFSGLKIDETMASCASDKALGPDRWVQFSFHRKRLGHY